MDSFSSRALVGMFATLLFLYVKFYSPTNRTLEFVMLAMAIAPTAQVNYFAMTLESPHFYVAGGMVVAAVTTAIMPSIKSAVLYSLANVGMQYIMVTPNLGYKEGTLVILEYLTIHFLIMHTLVARLQAMNTALEESIKYKHQLGIARSLSLATVATAHDLRSPISALTILSEQTTHTEQTSPLLRQATDRLSSHIDGLVKIGKHAFDRPVDVTEPNLNISSANKTLVFVADLLNYGFEGKIVTQLCDGEQNLNLGAEELERIASNLIRNSIQAFPKATIKISSFLSETSWQLRIEDDGPGIDPSSVDRVLRRGFVTTKKDGFGIGLQSAQYLVNLRKGNFCYSRAEPTGAVFQVTVPLRR